MLRANEGLSAEVAEVIAIRHSPREMVPMISHITCPFTFWIVSLEEKVGLWFLFRGFGERPGEARSGGRYRDTQGNVLGYTDVKVT